MKNKTLFYLTFLIIIFCSACYEPTEGCLDISATNFNAAADDPCEDCCTYPNLKLKILHQVTQERPLLGDTCINHSADSTYTNGDNNFFQINNISFYLSDFQLVKSDGLVVEVEDTLTLNLYEDFVTEVTKDSLIKDDIVLVKRNAFTYTVGEFRTPGLYIQLRFKVGLSAGINDANPDTLVTTHPLSSNQDMHYDDLSLGYIFQQFEIVKDTAESLTEIEVYQIDELTAAPVEVTLDLSLDLDPGFDAEIPLKVNYTTWLQGINFATDDRTTIESKIVSNTAEAFEIGE